MTNLKIYPLPTGEFIVSYFDPVRRKRVQEKFQDEKSARSHFQNLRSGVSAAKSPHSANVGRLMAEYLAKNPECSLSKSRKLIREFLETFELFAPQDLAEVSLRAFFFQYKTENDLSDRSMLVSRSMLNGFFKFLIDRELIAASPLEGIKFNRGVPFKRKPIIFESREIREFIRRAKRCSPVVFYPIFLIVQETGAGTQDILGLQWKDVNLKTRVLSLVRSKELQSRTFIMSEDLLSAISRIERVGDHVFVAIEKGTPMKKNILLRELHRFQLRISVNPATRFGSIRPGGVSERSDAGTGVIT